MDRPSPPRSILITGASSGLGVALARAYAEKGVFLALCGRDTARLTAVAEECRRAGAEVTADILDVADRKAAAAWLAKIDDAHPLDLVIANAAVAHKTSGIEEFDAQARKVFDINLYGTLNTVHPAIERMKARHAGQIALLSSVASFHGIPGSAAYSASKAAVRVYGEALRVMLSPDGIRVSVICPGYIRTPMVAAIKFRLPFLLEPDGAASAIKRGLALDKARIGFPWPMMFLAWLGAAVPASWSDALFRHTPRPSD